MVLAPSLVPAETVYESQDQFVSRAFGGKPPDPGVVWLTGDRKTRLSDILGHDYPALRIRYWCRIDRSAWILEEVGKELPITVGVVVKQTWIERMRVLVYRENRGGEVSSPAFTGQFGGVGPGQHHGLDTRIDGITGATLSVRALTRLAAVALYLHTQTDCANGP